jgi:hypothetical protein
MRLVMHSISRESPEPFAPPSGNGSTAARPSVVSTPLESSAEPGGSDSPLRRACISLPIDTMPEAMSSAIGPCSPGTAMASGAVDTPAARAP